MPDNSTFKHNLQTLIRSHGYTLADLSKHTGITSASLSRYTSTDRYPDIAQLIKLANHFNVSIDWLIGNDAPGNLSAEASEFANLYPRVSQDDRRIIKAVLDKYQDGGNR